MSVKNTKTKNRGVSQIKPGKLEVFWVAIRVRIGQFFLTKWSNVGSTSCVWSVPDSSVLGGANRSIVKGRISNNKQPNYFASNFPFTFLTTAPSKYLCPTTVFKGEVLLWLNKNRPDDSKTCSLSWGEKSNHGGHLHTPTQFHTSHCRTLRVGYHRPQKTPGWNCARVSVTKLFNRLLSKNCDSTLWNWSLLETNQFSSPGRLFESWVWGQFLLVI